MVAGLRRDRPAAVHLQPALSRRGRSADESRRRRGCDVDIPWSRGDAAAATWIFRGVTAPPRPRRGYSVEIAATPRPRRGYSVPATKRQRRGNRVETAARLRHYGCDEQWNKNAPDAFGTICHKEYFPGASPLEILPMMFVCADRVATGPNPRRAPRRRRGWFVPRGRSASAACPTDNPRGGRGFKSQDDPPHVSAAPHGRSPWWPRRQRNPAHRPALRSDTRDNVGAIRVRSAGRAGRAGRQRRGSGVKSSRRVDAAQWPQRRPTPKTSANPSSPSADALRSA